jgi:hypothetical protein
MIYTHHSHDTRTIAKQDKETVKLISMLDYNHCMGGADLKDQLLHSYLIEIERMNKWYMKLFCRILNVMIMHRNNTGKRTDFIFQHSIVEGLFVKYTKVTERKIPGLHSSDNTVPSLTERHVIVNFDRLRRKQD